MSKVYLVQEIPVDTAETGQPKYNILGAQKYGEIKTYVTRVFANDFISGSINISNTR